MDRRQFLTGISQVGLVSWMAQCLGCRGNQVAHVLNENDRDMVGSHTAGAETWEPLVQQSVSQLLGREATGIQTVSHEGTPCRKKICFVGLQNKGGEELGDFGEQIYEKIDTCINESELFEVINRHAVEAGLRQCQLRTDDLYLPTNQRSFAAAMERAEQPVDYLLYAKVTTGTTKNNKDYQRDYLLTLELVNMQTFKTEKVSAELRKGYHKTNIGRLKNYGH